MWHRLGRIGDWIGFAIVLSGLSLFAWTDPLTTALVVTIPTLGLLAFTGWYDYEHWRRRFLLWRYADVLAAAATLVDPHLDRLAEEMGKVLKWDGRWDYLWEPWIAISREFVATTVLPALTPAQQRIIADCDPILREQISSDASGRVFARAQQLGLVI